MRACDPRRTRQRVIGLIDYLVVRFPGSKMTGEGLPMIVELADRGIIRVLDLRVVSRGEDGSTVVDGACRLRR
jgi:hypothetical protein